MDPRRRGRPGAAALLLLTLLAADGARCAVPSVRLSRKLLPPEYEARLQVLKLALALDEEWSPVWSEKLNPETVADWHPDPEFCVRLTPAEDADDADDSDGSGDGRPVDTYATVRKIVDHCSFSGMYVKFGLTLIGASVQCLFNRFAQIDLSAVAAMVESGTDRFHAYLRELVAGYQEIADKLAVVGESLHDLVQLVTFFDDVEKLSVKLTKAGNKRKLGAFHLEVKEIAGKIGTNLDSEFDRLCAVDEAEWYDKENRETVTLEEFKDKKKKKKKKKDKKKDKKKEKKKKDTDDEDDEEDGEKKEKGKQKEKKDKGDKKSKKDKSEDDGEEESDKKKDKKGKKDDKDSDKEEGENKDKDSKKKKHEVMIEKANKLRTIMRKVFERLLVREMPSEMWKEIFTMNILMKPDDIKQVAVSAPKKKAREEIEFDL